MIGYGDMTFCTFWRDCAKASTCPRPLTDEIREKARKWWGSDDAPISVFAEQPDCHETTK